ncbi:hypothetical protein P692DRAFT_20840378 [Suillus brevipes Sb2]|nr:hypothetical protein P692DRAFT_20840378 [Suillus brevipes Sb2]
MPATRTRSSSQHRSRHAAERHIPPTRNLPGHLSLPNLDVPEVIVLSSDGENARPSEIGSSRSKKHTIKKPKFPIREVLEISSSDEEPALPKAPGNDGSSWQRENSKLKQQLYLAILLDATKLGDILACVIFAHLMHSPYILSDCGHCYCEGCLKGWLDETLTKHIRAHPTYDANRKLVLPNFPQVLQSIGPHLSYPIQMQLLAVCDASRRQQLEYTCPGCRFVVRDMVFLVGSALGQPDTHRESSGSEQVHLTPFPPNNQLYASYFYVICILL